MFGTAARRPNMTAPESTSGTDQTAVLASGGAAALADLGAATTVQPTESRNTTLAPLPMAPKVGTIGQITRRQAAEIGLYAGAALIALGVALTITRGWPQWSDTMRVASIGLSAGALIGVGLFVRLPWSRRVSRERRRAVSTMLTFGSGLGVAATGLALHVGRSHHGAQSGAHAAVGVILLGLVCVLARSAIAEVGLLLATAWAVWLMAPSGLASWAGLLGLGLLWSILGLRLARGPRVAAIAGSGLGLVAAVGLAHGDYAWPLRGLLTALVLFGLGMFLRGGTNAWLALGASAATALAGALAGGQLGPIVALVLAGMATMGVSGIALRSTRTS